MRTHQPNVAKSSKPTNPLRRTCLALLVLATLAFAPRARNQLAASGHCVDFVGSLRGTQGKNGVGHDGTPRYPNFDQDHEGHWGFRADEIATNAYTWANAAKPDIVLCHIGSNDMFQKQSVASTITDIGKIIDETRRANADVKFLLAKIIPFGAKLPFDVTQLNAALPALAASKSTSRSPVILVDHFTGWDPKLHSIDDVHPNETGEQRMANTWHSAILDLRVTCVAKWEKFGTGCASTVGTPTLDAVTGQRPMVGSPFPMTVSPVPKGAAVLGFIGLSNVKHSGVPLPIDLTVIGMAGCKLWVSPRWTLPLGSSSTGTLSWSLPASPNQPLFSGLKIYLQAAVASPGTNALGLVSTNGGIATLGTK